jgi:cytochrome c-type biogenesis protein
MEDLQMIILSGGFSAVLIAFVGGILTFFTPCVLPIVPPYLAFMTGYSVRDLQDEKAQANRGRVLFAALAFVTGFSLVFVVLGLAFTSLSQYLRTYLGSLQSFAGIMIFVMGMIILKPPLLTGARKTVLTWAAALIMVAAALGLAPAKAVLGPILVAMALLMVGFFNWPALYSDMRFEAKGQNTGLAKAFVMGLAFAFGWTACTGPLLAAVLMVASESAQSELQGALTMLGFAAGLAVPFVLTAVAVGRALKFFAQVRKYLSAIEFGAALLLMVAGMALYAGWIAVFALWMERFIPAF